MTVDKESLNLVEQQRLLESFASEIKEGYIKDFISGEWVKDKPEEQVRQTYLRKLVEDYGYDPKNIKTEVSIKSGQTETKKPADIVVFDGKGFDAGLHAYIIIEVKRKDRKDGKEQLVLCH